MAEPALFEQLVAEVFNFGSGLAWDERDPEQIQLARAIQSEYCSCGSEKSSDVVNWWVGEGVGRRLEDEEIAAALNRHREEQSILRTAGERRRNSPTS